MEFTQMFGLFSGQTDDFVSTQTSARKCFIFWIYQDALASIYRNDLLKVLLPLLQQQLSNTSNWKARESGILALGAIAEGCEQVRLIIVITPQTKL